MWVGFYFYVLHTHFVVNWCSFHHKNITYLFSPCGRTAFILKLFEGLSTWGLLYDADHIFDFSDVDDWAEAGILA